MLLLLVSLVYEGLVSFKQILHLLPLVREASSGSCNIPKTKEFWCRGRKVHFNEGRVSKYLIVHFNNTFEFELFEKATLVECD